MKTNRKKIMVIGIVVILLIGTNLVVSASNNHNRSLAAKTTPRAEHFDITEGKANNTPLDLLFEGLSSGNVLKIETVSPVSLAKRPKPAGSFKKTTHLTGENTPLDLLFRGVTLNSSDKGTAI